MGELERFAPEDIETTWRRAKGYALSGYFADAKSAEQAFVKISAGAEMGLTPFQSMTGIHIIQGKPVVGAGLLAAMVDQHEEYDFDVEWEPNEANATACTVTITKNGKERGKSRFSLEDAQRAGLNTANWSKFPSNMLYARAMSNAVRWYAPGVTGTSTYVEGEIPTFEAPQHANAEAKPRTRVTAEIIPPINPTEPVSPEVKQFVEEMIEDGLVEVVEPFDPATEPAPTVVKPPGPLAEPLAAGPLPLRVQLTHLSVQEKADLWNFAGMERKTKMADVKARLIAYADELGLDFTEEPDARGILDEARARVAKTGDAAAFQHMLDTDEDLDPGDQASLEALT